MPLRTLLAAGLVLGPPLLFCGLIAHFQVDIPYFDDYPAILHFANRLVAMKTAGERLSWMLAAQHVDYKLVFLHGMVALELWLTNHVDFNVLNAVGDSFIVWTGVLLWRIYFRAETNLRRRLWLFLPVALLWFPVNDAEALDWAAGSLLYQPVIFFSLLALYLLAGPQAHRAQERGRHPGSGARFAGACVAAALACLTAVNGALLGPLGLAVLLRRRSFLRALVWCGVIALALSPYVYRYTPQPHRSHAELLKMVIFLLTFAGNGMSSYKLALPAGVVMLGVLLWAARVRYDRINPAAALSTLWLLGSAAAAAYGRTPWGLAFSFISRYKIFSDLLYVSCYGFLAEHLVHHPRLVPRRRLVYALALSLAVLFFVRNTLVGVQILRDQRTLLEGNAQYYWQDPVHHSPMHFDDAAMTAYWMPHEVEEKQDLEESMRLNIYTLPGAAWSRPAMR